LHGQHIQQVQKNVLEDKKLRYFWFDFCLVFVWEGMKEAISKPFVPKIIWGVWGVSLELLLLPLWLSHFVLPIDNWFLSIRGWWYVWVGASRKSFVCSIVLELKFGMTEECSMLGEIGDDIALHRSSGKLLIHI
jgi:hypothetical protein